MHNILDIHLTQKILEDNDQLALHNREHFDEEGITAFNFMSAPGAGKTTLIIELIKALKNQFACAVIEGDMVGELDTKRMKDADINAFQISTGKACHLDASMVARLLHEQSFDGTDILFLENVGNLVCPAEFALGEHVNVVLLSVSEGDDKPFKYPVIFQKCDAVVLTKCDLLPHVDFSIERAKSFLKDLNPDAAVFEVVAGKRPYSNNQFDQLVAWLSEKGKSFQK
ncbi:hydrogenase nickel incorporation protein HypB [bacterium]|nr:hydrogenase nickel incorporation protein HypB [bacterium]QQR59527.1 MAG: hydrogenase nickel incorporation protein HypB [Candidatus Melainabacteria bacterium]